MSKWELISKENAHKNRKDVSMMDAQECKSYMVELLEARALQAESDLIKCLDMLESVMKAHETTVPYDDIQALLNQFKPQ